MQIWDTAGQEKFRTIINTYYKKTSIFYIVYDCQSAQSFEEVDYFAKEIEEYKDP